MDTSRYKAFLYAVEQGTVTGAAEKLNYTPSGVSQLIQALENELGLQLLHRSKKGVSVTAEGERFLPAVRELLRQEDIIGQMASEFRGLAVGTVTIASYSSIAAHWLPRVIHRFQKEYPGIEIQVIEGIRQEVEEWLAEKRADVGFMSYKEPMEMEWIPLAEDPMLALLPRSHPLASADSYPIPAIAEEETVIMAAMGSDEDVEALLDEYGYKPEFTFRTVETQPVIAMVEQNIGMSITNRLITERLNFDVVKLPLDPPHAITLGIAMDSWEKASPAVKKFVEMAVQMLSRPE